jgi:hypothetical protein
MMDKVHKLGDSEDYFVLKYTIQYYILIQFPAANYKAVCRHVADSE